MCGGGGAVFVQLHIMTETWQILRKVKLSSRGEKSRVESSQLVMY